MSKRGMAILFSLGVFFLWANHLLTTPGSGGSDPAAPGSVGNSEKKRVFREMASFVQAHPEVVRAAPLAEHDPKAPSVAGVPLDQKSANELMTPDGLSSFSRRFQAGDSAAPVIEELNQAWLQVGVSDFAQRKALLGVNRGLADVSGDPALKENMLREFDSYYSQESPFRNSDYAGQALQDYLDHEKDEEKKMEELQKRGIPIYRAPASETAASSVE